MNFKAERIGEVFFGSSPNSIKGTVEMTLGIPWFFRRLNKQKWMTSRENAGSTENCRPLKECGKRH
jgi:hypothetical protein